MPKKNTNPIFSSKPIVGKEKAHEDSVQTSLKTIYRDTDGQTVDVTRLEVYKGRGVTYFLQHAVTLAIVLGLVFIGYSYARSTFFGGEVDETVILSWDAPQAVTSGEMVTMVLQYENTFDVPLADVELTLQYPDNFIFNESTPGPSDQDGRIWQITGISAKEKGTVTIQGRLFGKIAENGTIQARLSYTPENFSSPFEARTSWLMQIAAGRIVSEKNFPGQAVAGEEITYTLQLFLAEEQEEQLTVRVVPKFPEDFELTEGSEQFILPENAWEISNVTTQDKAPNNLDGAESSKITFKGRFTSDKDPEQTVVLEYHVQGPDGNFYLEKEDKLTTQIVQGEFLMSLIVNGETTEIPVNLGDELNYTLTYKNQSASEARDVTLTFTFPSGYLNFDTLIMSPKGIRDGDTVTWTQEEIENLNALDSGDGGTIDLTVKINESLPTGISSTDFTNLAKAFIGSFNDVEANIEVKSNEIIALINSNLEWKQSARYYNNDDIPIGSGPIPPKVGETTELYIFWDLEPSAHTMSNVKVRGKLPANVSWKNKENTTKGLVSYNEETRTVTWQLDALETGGENVHAQFQVSIKPTFDDINKIILLMPAPTLTALNQDTEADITITGKALTTDLDGDPVLSGKGLVES